jgi:hypothetical protein
VGAVEDLSMNGLDRFFSSDHSPSSLAATNTTLPQRLLQFSDMPTISGFDDTNDLDGGNLRSTKRPIMSDFFDTRSD